MGCLNSNENFSHWFGNIHLSGPCNRSCYFCIGQHMMALDPLNNLNEWPLKNIDRFVDQCIQHNIIEVNVTGSDTDPLLYKHTKELYNYLKVRIPNLVFGLRTNAVLALDRADIVELYDKFSISITTLDPDLYVQTMGQGNPPDIKAIVERFGHKRIKANVVLCPETVESGDVLVTVQKLSEIGITKINLREPYGQAHIGDPFTMYTSMTNRFSMPVYQFGDAEVVYWDVHYVEVESVNLYANGEVSTTYPVTKGHCPETGKVLDQSHFGHGRVNQQWVNFGKG